MKKIVFSLGLALCIGGVASAQQISWKDLKGRWETPDGGGIEIRDSAHIFLVYGDQKKPINQFRADFSKYPAQFDFVIKDSLQTISMKSILVLVNDDIMKWQVFETDDHPAHFTSSEGEMVYLRRKASK
jgi:hypothetical protein